jgi:hypothetical protein
MLAVASSEWEEDTLIGWLRDRILPLTGDEPTEDEAR